MIQQTDFLNVKSLTLQNHMITAAGVGIKVVIQDLNQIPGMSILIYFR